MERQRLEVILSARDQASAVLMRFGERMLATSAMANRAVNRISRSIRQAGMDLSLMAGSARGLGRTFIWVGTAIRSPFLAILSLAQLGVIYFTKFARAVADAAMGVVRFAMAVVRWLGTTVINIISRVTRMATLMGLAFAAAAAMTARSVLSAAGQMERYESQFAVLVGGIDRAREHLDTLLRFAATTPFEIEGVVEASLLLEAFNIRLGDVENTLRLVGDAAIAMHVPLDQVIRVLAKAKAGIFTIREFAPVGVTRERLQQYGVQFSARGQVLNRAQLFPATIAVLSRFSGMMERMMGNLEQRTANLADQFFRLRSAAGEGLLEGAKVGLAALDRAIGDLIPRVRELFRAIGQMFGPVVLRLAEGMIDTFKRIVDVITTITSSGRWRRFVTVILAIFQLVQRIIAKWLAWLQENWTSVWDAIASRFFVAAQRIVEFVYGIVDSIRELWNSRQMIWEWAREVARAAVQVGTAIQEFVINQVNAMIEWGRQHGWKGPALIAGYQGAKLGLKIGSRFGPIPAGAGLVIGTGAGIAAAYYGHRKVMDIAGSKIEDFRSTIVDAGHQFLNTITSRIGPIGRGVEAAFQTGRGRGVTAFGQFVRTVQDLEQTVKMEAAGLYMRRVAPGVWMLERASDSLARAGHGLEENADQMQNVLNILENAGEDLGSASDALEGTAATLGSAAQAAQRMHEALQRVYEQQAQVGLPEDVQFLGLLSRWFEAQGLPGAARVMRIRQAGLMRQYTQQLTEPMVEALRQGIMPSLTAFENAVEAQERLRQLLEAIGAGVEGAGPRIGQGRLTGIPAMQAGLRTLSEWLRAGHPLAWRPMPPEPPQLAPLTRDQIEALLREPYTGGVPIVSVNINGDVNDLTTLKAHVNRALEEFWDEQVRLESVDAGWRQ